MLRGYILLQYPCNELLSPMKSFKQESFEAGILKATLFYLFCNRTNLQMYLLKLKYHGVYCVIYEHCCSTLKLFGCLNSFRTRLPSYLNLLHKSFRQFKLKSPATGPYRVRMKKCPGRWLNPQSSAGTIQGGEISSTTCSPKWGVLLSGLLWV